jgi:hypothetical protein
VSEVEKADEQLSPDLELYADKHLVKAINCRVVPVAGYVMNVCRLSKTDLEKLDMIVKRAWPENSRVMNDSEYLDGKSGGREG